MPTINGAANPELTPAPDGQKLRHHEKVSRDYATSHRGRTGNEVKCPHSQHILPQCQGYMTTCSCGLNIATWGNGLYIWPTDLKLEPADRRPPPPPTGRPQPDADAVYRGTGGSTFILTPLTEKAYTALLTATSEIADGGADWAGEYPSLRLNAPTLTNVAYNPALREHYRTAMRALKGMKLAVDTLGNSPYPVGDPESIWG